MSLESVKSLYKTMIAFILILTSFSTLLAVSVNRGLERRIYNGKEVHRYSYPFMVGINSGEQIFYCGGTLYKMDIVITAAHCFSDYKEKYYAHLNRHFNNKGLEQTPEKKYNVIGFRKLVNKAKYMGRYRTTIDLAVARIDREEGEESPIILDDKSRGWIEDLNIKVIGWGRVGDNLADHLSEVDLKIYSTETCKTKEIPFAPSLELCAGPSPGELGGVCRYDSGGPVFHVTENGEYILLGAVSRVIDVCGGMDTTFFANYISSFIEWIDATIDRLYNTNEYNMGRSSMPQDTQIEEELKKVVAYTPPEPEVKPDNADSDYYVDVFGLAPAEESDVDPSALPKVGVSEIKK